MQSGERLPASPPALALTSAPVNRGAQALVGFHRDILLGTADDQSITDAACKNFPIPGTQELSRMRARLRYSGGERLSPKARRPTAARGAAGYQGQCDGKC